MTGSNWYSIVHVLNRLLGWQTPHFISAPNAYPYGRMVHVWSMVTVCILRVEIFLHRGCIGAFLNKNVVRFRSRGSGLFTRLLYGTMDGDDRNTVPSAKRQRGGARLHETSELTEADAADLAMCLRNNSFKKHQGGLTLLPADAPVVQRYSAARRQLQKTCSDLALVGFRLFGPCDHILNDADAQRILDFCKTISWEPRRGSQGRPPSGHRAQELWCRYGR